MNTPDQVYTLLRDALLKARADGLRIINIRFGDGKTCCCAAIALTRYSVDDYWCNVSEAASKAGIDLYEMDAVIDGFDDNYDPEPSHPDFYAIGQNLRAEFIEQKGEA